jgi:hypothetical protein
MMERDLPEQVSQPWLIECCTRGPGDGAMAQLDHACHHDPQGAARPGCTRPSVLSLLYMATPIFLAEGWIDNKVNLYLHFGID